MYGISAFGLSQRLHISRAEAKKIIEDYFANFPAISAYIEDTLASAREFGYVETLFGRRHYLPDINSKNGTVRSLAERTAINAPIQGTSADIIKLAMINVNRRIAEEGLESRMVLQIHDELLFDSIPDEVEKLKEIVCEEMQNAITYHSTGRPQMTLFDKIIYIADYMEPNRDDLMRARMDEYVAICARLAKEYGCIFVDSYRRNRQKQSPDMGHDSIANCCRP
jgi:HD superfamily phosphohydrolase YqeK